MLQNKHRVRAIFGMGLLFAGLPQLSMELSGEMEAVFSFSWLTVSILAVAANWRRMQYLNLIRRRREEALRRIKWLEGERQLRRRRGRVLREQKRGIQTV
ncbi:hypothetical protein ACFO25_00190 [Paenactinomyces guangxiensis]|uniref:Uncharacterized protein n=1 Tax=Paenactinomyces guangxiensis TaxID=1490290 RepID=A0A7W2A925_9BACL|nr:hypothetical protein [Paenactinomyces guangxiensis]MBA4495260.1 hypothetical protein [Paenactinomyces guangxiensis]MBH8592344.1 hypothetical protein [Paenactinomyces guangxiensis]